MEMIIALKIEASIRRTPRITKIQHGYRRANFYDAAENLADKSSSNRFALALWRALPAVSTLSRAPER
jgi:hypothetical protein